MITIPKQPDTDTVSQRIAAAMRYVPALAVADAIRCGTHIVSGDEHGNPVFLDPLEVKKQLQEEGLWKDFPPFPNTSV